MPRKNYKWNISMDEGRKFLLDVIKGVLQEQKNETMEINELLLLIQNRYQKTFFTFINFFESWFIAS